MGWFHRIAKTCQMPLMLNQFGEDVFLSRPGELTIDPNTSVAIQGIVRVTAQESVGPTGQAMIESADLLLPVHSEDFEPGHFPEFLLYDGKIEKLTTAHIVHFRRQVFAIEAIGSEDSGFRKLQCKARRSEVTSRSVLQGRL